jgi:hypothetical protein
MTALDDPYEEPDQDRNTDQGDQGFEEAEGNKHPDQMPPVELRRSRDRNTQTTCAIRLREVNDLLAFICYGQRGYGAVKRPGRRPVDQALKRRLLKAVGNVEIAGDVVLEIDTHAGPGTVRLFRRKGRSFLRSDNQDFVCIRDRIGRLPTGRDQDCRRKHHPDRSNRQPSTRF